MLFSAAFSAALGYRLPTLVDALSAIPAAAFAPAVTSAVRLHRTTDAKQLSRLWRHCCGYAAIGTILTIATVLEVGAINTH
jgi:hypothetical protein